jgi:hypothetical protein
MTASDIKCYEIHILSNTLSIILTFDQYNLKGGFAYCNIRCHVKSSHYEIKYLYMVQTVFVIHLNDVKCMIIKLKMQNATVGGLLYP